MSSLRTILLLNRTPLLVTANLTTLLPPPTTPPPTTHPHHQQCLSLPLLLMIRLEITNLVNQFKTPIKMIEWR